MAAEKTKSFVAALGRTRFIVTVNIALAEVQFGLLLRKERKEKSKLPAMGLPPCKVAGNQLRESESSRLASGRNPSAQSAT